MREHCRSWPSVVVHSVWIVWICTVFLASSPGALASEWGAIQILGREVAAGTKAQLSFFQETSFLGSTLDVPIFVARGTRPGPTLCVTAAVHGDEVNGVEIARHVFAETHEAELSGTLIVIPFVNVWGFRSGNRYLPDRRDLNRGFPGSRGGSTASRIAWSIFEGVIRKCNALVDLHTGSNDRINVPQVRVDLENAAAREIAMRFAVGIVLDGAGPEGSLRRAATDAGIPAVIYEAGGPNYFEENEIARGIEGVTNIMEYLRMIGTKPPAPDPQQVYRSSRWVRALGGGIFLVERKLGDEVEAGDRLGTVTDPITSERIEIKAPIPGTLIGMARPQVVLSGFALFHLARRDARASEASGTE